MRALRAGITLFIVGLCALAARPGTPAHADTVCRGVLAEAGTTVAETIIVPAGARCEAAGIEIAGTITVEPGAALTLNDATVTGTITLASGASLRAVELTLTGNIVATGAALIDVEASTIIGTIVANATLGAITFTTNMLTGGLTLAGGGGPVAIAANTITGTVLVTWDDPTAVLYADNTLDGTAICNGAPCGS
jgi:hypothetical protein